MNNVIAGDYSGHELSIKDGKIKLHAPRRPEVIISKSNVASCQVVTEKFMTDVGSGISRSIVGGALFGPVGVLAGAALTRSTKSIYLAIEFRNGRRTLLELEPKVFEIISREIS